MTLSAWWPLLLVVTVFLNGWALLLVSLFLVAWLALVLVSSD